MSDETRAAISRAMMGVRKTAAYRAAISRGLTGVPKSEAHRLAISQAMKGVMKGVPQPAQLGNQNARKYESTPDSSDMAAYMQVWRAAQKEKQQTKEAQGQTTIDQALKKAKK